MESIVSLKNPRVITWRSLKDRKARLEQQSFLVEGTRMVQEALLSDFPVKARRLLSGMRRLSLFSSRLPHSLLPR